MYDTQVSTIAIHIDSKKLIVLVHFGATADRSGRFPSRSRCGFSVGARATDGPLTCGSPVRLLIVSARSQHCIPSKIIIREFYLDTSNRTSILNQVLTHEIVDPLGLNWFLYLSTDSMAPVLPLGLNSAAFCRQNSGGRHDSNLWAHDRRITRMS